MTETQLSCLQAAVTIARDEQIERVEKLKQRLRDRGFTTDDVNEAILFWAKYEMKKEGR